MSTNPMMTPDDGQRPSIGGNNDEIWKNIDTLWGLLRGLKARDGKMLADVQPESPYGPLKGQFWYDTDEEA